MPLLKRVRVLAAKVETTPGTAVALSAADAAFHVYDVEINPDISVGERMSSGSFGSLAAPQSGRGGSVTFKINPYDGATVPDWATTFLPACGLVNSLGTFTPTAEAPGSNVKTLTIGVYENGLYKQLRGCAGTFSISCPTGQMAEMTFTFTGIWDDPSDVAIIAPTYPTDLPLRCADIPFAFGTWNPCIANFSFDLGNNVILRQCTTDASGYDNAMITDRAPTGQFDPEGALVAGYDVYADFKAATERAIAYSIPGATLDLAFNLTSCQITNIQEGDRDGIQIETVDYRVNGDDFTLTIT